MSQPTAVPSIIVIWEPDIWTREGFATKKFVHLTKIFFSLQTSSNLFPVNLAIGFCYSSYGSFDKNKIWGYREFGALRTCLLTVQALFFRAETTICISVTTYNLLILLTSYMCVTRRIHQWIPVAGVASTFPSYFFEFVFRISADMFTECTSPLSLCRHNDTYFGYTDWLLLLTSQMRVPPQIYECPRLSLLWLVPSLHIFFICILNFCRRVYWVYKPFAIVHADWHVFPWELPITAVDIINVRHTGDLRVQPVR